MFAVRSLSGANRTSQMRANVAIDPDRTSVAIRIGAAVLKSIAVFDFRSSIVQRLGVAMNTQEQWQLTLTAAELYERYPARYILGPWAPLLVDSARIRAGERVLDVLAAPGSWLALRRIVSAPPGASSALT
jgi:hypothetical protein